MSWWDDVAFVVTGEQVTATKRKLSGKPIERPAPDAAAPPAPGGAGGGAAGTISMSREEMEDTLRRAQNLLNDLNLQLNSSRISSNLNPITFANMKPPAQDPASLAATSAANNAGKHYYGHLRRQQAYLNKVINKMSEALGRTVQADRDAADAARKAGEGLVG